MDQFWGRKCIPIHPTQFVSVHGPLYVPPHAVMLCRQALLQGRDVESLLSLVDIHVVDRHKDNFLIGISLPLNVSAPSRRHMLLTDPLKSFFSACFRDCYDF